MQKIRILLGVVTTLAAVTACDPTVTPGHDSGLASTVDSAVDGGSSRTDGGGSDTGTATGGTCATPININTMGTALATGTGRTIVSTNVGTAAAAQTTVANGTCAVDMADMPTARHEVVFQYTLQTGGHLSASTDDPATSQTLDSIVWVLDACTTGGNELACNDDDDAGYLSNATTDTALSAGTTVFIVVAGYMATDGSDMGAFTLNVTELQPHAAGAVCDSSNLYCVDGYTCVQDAPDAVAGHCLADGANNGTCRIASPFCDTGLQCSETTPTGEQPGICQVPVAAGAVCDTGTHYVCVVGNTCQSDDGAGAAGHCLANGAEYGACNVTGTACNTGLTCSNASPTVDDTGTCQTPIVANDPCVLGHHSVCVTGFECQSNDGMASAGTCLANGAEYGNCLLAAPFCATGLTCSATTPTADDTGTCQMPVASAAACTRRHYLCVANNTCIQDTGSTTMGHCLVDGANGGSCRAAAPECDAALTCDPESGLCG